MTSRILIVTYDLKDDNLHKMPWKTVVEIGKHLSELGLKVTILNICSTGQVVHLKDANVEMTTISRSSKAIYNYLKKSQFNIIYWPTT
jgi:hypothetical protein